MKFDFNSSTFRAWLTPFLPLRNGPLRVEKISGGQSNPTFRLAVSDQRIILRAKPIGVTLQSAHAVDREYRVLSALHKTEVPVPRPIALCDDASVLGSIFYLMEDIPGRIFWDPRLPGLSATDRNQLFDSMNASIATLHTVNVERLYA